MYSLNYSTNQQKINEHDVTFIIKLLNESTKNKQYEHDATFIIYVQIIKKALIQGIESIYVENKSPS